MFSTREGLILFGRPIAFIRMQFDDGVSLRAAGLPGYTVLI